MTETTRSDSWGLRLSWLALGSYQSNGRRSLV